MLWESGLCKVLAFSLCWATLKMACETINMPNLLLQSPRCCSFGLVSVHSNLQGSEGGRLLSDSCREVGGYTPLPCNCCASQNMHAAHVLQKISKLTFSIPIARIIEGCMSWLESCLDSPTSSF